MVELDSLVEAGLLTQDQAEKARDAWRTKSRFACLWILKQRWLDENALMEHFTRQSGLSNLSLAEIRRIHPSLREVLPDDLLVHFRVLPLDIIKSKLTLAVSVPLSSETIEDLEFFTGLSIEQILVKDSELVRSVEFHFALRLESFALPVKEAAPPSEEESEDILPAPPDEAPASESPRPEESSQLSNDDLENLQREISDLTMESGQSAVISVEIPEVESDEEDEYEEFEEEFLLPTEELGVALAEAENRNEVIEISMDWLLRFFEDALFCSIKQTVLSGYVGKGNHLDKETAKKIQVDFSGDETLQALIEERVVQMAVPESKKLAEVMVLAGHPSTIPCAVLPIELKGRVIGLFIGLSPLEEDLTDDEEEWNEVAEQIAAAIEVQILAQKIGVGS